MARRWWMWWRRRRERRRQEICEQWNRWHVEQDQAYREAVDRILRDAGAGPDGVDNRPTWDTPTVGRTEPRMTLGEQYRGNGGRWPV